MSTANLKVYVSNIVDEESTHNDVVYMECVDAEGQYAAYEEMPTNAEETSHIDVVYTECFDAERQSAHIEMFPDAEETSHIDVVYTECFDAEGQSAYIELFPDAKDTKYIDVVYKECFDAQGQSAHEEISKTTNPEYTDLNIAHNSRDNQSIQTKNSRSRTIHVQYRLLVFISCFLITLVVTNIVTFITTKNKFSAIKKTLTPCTESKCLNGGSCAVLDGLFYCSCDSGFSGRLCEEGPCFSNPCFNSGSCTVLGKHYTCNCQTGTDGERCQDVFNGTITSPGYPSNYRNNINDKWTIDVGLGNKVRLKFTLFEHEKDYDYVKIYDGRSIKCASSIKSFTGNIPPKDVISTGRYMLIVFTSNGYKTARGFRVVIYKRQSI